jgi:hypothetical protein
MQKLTLTFGFLSAIVLSLVSAYLMMESKPGWGWLLTVAFIMFFLSVEFAYKANSK